MMLSQDANITALNSRAISLMKRSSYDESLKPLRRSLRLLLETKIAKNEIGRTENMNDNDDATRTLGVEFKFVRLNAAVDDFWGRDTPCSSTRDDAAGFCCNPLYDRALMMSGPETDEVAISDKNTEQVSCAILYNMALAHHLNGLKGGVRQEHNYRTAMTLYDAAARIFRGWGSDFSSTDLLVILAVTSNQQHIHLSSFRWDEAQDCYDRMCIVLENLSPAGHSTMGDDIHHFSMAVLLPAHFSAASAA